MELYSELMLPAKLFHSKMGSDSKNGNSESSRLDLRSKITQFVARYNLTISAVLVGLGVFSLVMTILLMIKSPDYLNNHDIDQARAVSWDMSARDSELGSNENEQKTIRQSIAVDVSGSVEMPGLYYLLAGSRTADALIAAGGLSKQADQYYVNKVLNLSTRLEDSQKLYIPAQKERAWIEELFVEMKNDLATEGVHDQKVAENEVVSQSDSQTVGSQISINWATNSELQTLPGIGEKRAADLIAGRPYASVNEVVEKGVLTQGIWDKIKDLVNL